MATESYIEVFGRTGKPAEMRFTPKGTPVCDFSLAAYAGGSGEEKETIWWDCQAWGKLAETISEQLNAKGLYVFVAGDISRECWKDKNTGERKSKLKVTVDRYRLLTPKEAQARQASRPASFEEEEEIIPAA